MCKGVNDLIIGGLFKLHARGAQPTKIAHETWEVIEYKIGKYVKKGGGKAGR
jgi:hypothetical protein